MFAEFYAKLYEDEEGKRTTKKKRNLKRALNAKNQYQSSRTKRFKMPSTASKEEKQETVAECELNN